MLFRSPTGEAKAARIRTALEGHAFALALTSPMQRARKTCEIAGFGQKAKVEPDLFEWNYGDYEGKTTAEIQRERPGWNLFRDGVPGGETIEQVAARARAVLDRALLAEGDAVLFAHGHILRILTACWLGLGPAAARLFALGTACISILSYEHETRVIERWNLQ